MPPTVFPSRSSYSVMMMLSRTVDGTLVLVFRGLIVWNESIARLSMLAFSSSGLHSTSFTCFPCMAFLYADFSTYGCSSSLRVCSSDSSTMLSGVLFLTVSYIVFLRSPWVHRSFVPCFLGCVFFSRFLKALTIFSSSFCFSSSSFCLSSSTVRQEYILGLSKPVSRIPLASRFLRTLYTLVGGTPDFLAISAAVASPVARQVEMALDSYSVNPIPCSGSTMFIADSLLLQ